MRKQLPFALLGLDTDNDTVFMNETLKAYCDAASIVFTRCRPYRKNDQAFVEQKNGAVVRRMVGYRRFEGLEAATLLAKLYRSARLFVNFFQPSFKLIAKQRDGARVRKTYSPPATPHQRLIADARTIKYEEVYLHAYKTVSEARVGIGRYLTFYNTRRPHSSLDRQTPDQAYFNALTPMMAAA